MVPVAGILRQRITLRTWACRHARVMPFSGALWATRKLFSKDKSLLTSVRNARKESPYQILRNVVSCLITVAFTVGPIVITMNDTVGGIGVVRGSSMEPTFNPRSDSKRSIFSDRILLSRWHVKNQNYRCGEVVVLR